MGGRHPPECYCVSAKVAAHPKQKSNVRGVEVQKCEKCRTLLRLICI